MEHSHPWLCGQRASCLLPLWSAGRMPAGRTGWKPVILRARDFSPPP